MNSRKDKINLLKGILTGQKNINDLIPPQVRLFIKREEDDYFKGGNPEKKYFVKNQEELKKLFPRDTVSVIYICRIDSFDKE